MSSKFFTPSALTLSEYSRVCNGPWYVRLFKRSDQMIDEQLLENGLRRMIEATFTSLLEQLAKKADSTLPLQADLRFDEDVVLTALRNQVILRLSSPVNCGDVNTLVERLKADVRHFFLSPDSVMVVGGTFQVTCVDQRFTVYC